MRRRSCRSSGTCRVRLGHAPLQLESTADGIHRTGEFDQHPVAHDLDQPAAMLADHRLENLPAAQLEGGERAGLVRLHQAAVADHVGQHDSGETPTHPERSLSHHSKPPGSTYPAAVDPCSAAQDKKSMLV